MRWLSLRRLGTVLLCLAGCWTTDRPPKPPPHPEEFVEPPRGDARFSKPPEYPKSTLFADQIKLESLTNGVNTASTPRMPARSPMGPMR